MSLSHSILKVESWDSFYIMQNECRNIMSAKNKNRTFHRFWPETVSLNLYPRISEAWNYFAYVTGS